MLESEPKKTASTRGAAASKKSSRSSASKSAAPKAAVGKATATKAKPKKAATKKATARKATKKPASKTPARTVAITAEPETARRTVSVAERRRMIADAAYRRAQSRQFRDGSPQQDWFDAEAEVDARLAAMGAAIEPGN